MSELVTGIDLRGSKKLAATVNYGAGRPVIESFSSGDDCNEFLKKDDSQIVLAVSDLRVIVKRLKMVGGEDIPIEERIVFELVQSQIEAEEKFVFDFHPAGNNGMYLGFVVRQENLLVTSSDYGVSFDNGLSPIYRVRAIALGQGYLEFAVKGEGGLVCLIDLSEDVASICILYQNHLVDIASLKLSGRNLSTPDVQEQLAIDLKTIISYRLSILMDQSICVPVSSLFMSGWLVDDEFRLVVQKYFPVGVSAPEISSGFLTSLDKPDLMKPEDFLVALGLTVN